MNNNDYNEIVDILSDLLNELVSEEDKLKDIVNGHSYKIDELTQQIDLCRRNEDIDFRVFSPRNISYDNSEKISALENECSQYEREKSDAVKRLGYYTGKTDKIRKVLSLLKRGTLNKDSVDIVLNNTKRERDPFDFLFGKDEDTEEVADEITEDIVEEDFDEDVNINSEGIPVDEIKRVCRKVEFSEKIINNDRVRAKIELKDIVSDLKELIRVYGN